MLKGNRTNWKKSANLTHLTSSGTTSRTATPVLASAGLRGHVARVDGDWHACWQRQGPALEIVPVTILQRLRVAARTWQPVQERGARATAVGVVLLAARGRVGTDEHQSPVVDQRLVLRLTSRWTVLPSVTADHVQRLKTLKLLGAAAPRVRPSSSSRTFRKRVVDEIQIRSGIGWFPR